MGWTTSCSWRSRQDVIDRRLQDCFYVNDKNKQIKYTLLGHSDRPPVLWTLWERTIIDLNTSDFSTITFIGCDLISSGPRGKNKEWGYKDMCESAGLYYYSCPLKFLEAAPEENPEWRKGVRKWHADAAARRKFKPQPGQILQLQYSTMIAAEYVKKIGVPWHMIKDRKGRPFRCKSSQFTGKVLEQWPEETCTTK